MRIAKCLALALVALAGFSVLVVTVQTIVVCACLACGLD